MKRLILLSLFILVFCSSIFAQGSPPLLIGRLTVNQTHVAFSYAGDIWSVPLTGGETKRLTSDPNEESFPVFSPDGSQIAFSRLLGGSWDVFVMPASGGEAKRITYMNEDDLVVNWSPDGKKILFISHRDEENVFRLYTIDVDGVFPTALPLPFAREGAYSPDGTRIAYTPRKFIFGEWRYYRGGMASQIWIANLKDGTLETIPNQNVNDFFPMWIGDKLYFVSDRTGIFNLYAYDFKTKQPQQLTTYKGQGIRGTGASKDAIAYIQDGQIHVYNLQTKQDSIVKVNVTPDTNELKARAVNPLRNLEQASLSTNGDKVVFGARGEVLLFDPNKSETTNITNTSGAAERYPVMSPDNNSVAYFSDESGEYQLHIKTLNGGAVKKISVEDKPTFYRELVWSPDSKKIAFNDRRLNLWIADVMTGKTQKVDTSVYSANDTWNPVWSPDSRWLAYNKYLHNRISTIFVYDATTNKATQLTDGITHTESPAFDANGKYLYFLSSANAGTTNYYWGVLKGILANPLLVKRVHALVLQNNTPPPLLIMGAPNPEAKINESLSEVKIDFDNLYKRFVNLPLPVRDYARVESGKPGKIFLAVNEWPDAPGAENPQLALYYCDVANPRFNKLVQNINGYTFSSDGSRVLYLKGRDRFIVPSEQEAKEGEGKLNLQQVSVTIEPRQEWQQIYREAWRTMRDWFYDPNYHGQNLPALEKYYAGYLPTTTRRDDLNRLINMMLGHISVSHLGAGGGDVPPPSGQPNRIGLLGADYEIANGRYRFKKIFRTNAYYTARGAAPAPLDQQGVDVREGDYLISVDGQDVPSTKNVYTFFDGKIGRPTKIVVSANADGSNARTYTVFPLAGENGLRRSNWAENNRQLVEKMSGGKLGYIYVEDYGLNGTMNAIRGLAGYSDRAGVIIDQRFNGGGITPDYLIEWLQRKPLYYYMFRGGDDIPTPVNPGPGTKVLIINEYNGSAAETFAFMYKLGKVGPIVGKRTSGGGIGPYYPNPNFVDGGSLRLPNRAAYNPDGTSWGVENIGVAPDYDVEITPKDFMSGRDSQLEKAIQVAMTEMQKAKQQTPKRPPFPVHPYQN
jgi:tricorn protease